MSNATDVSNRKNKTLKDDPQGREINEVDSDDSKESQEVL